MYVCISVYLYICISVYLYICIFVYLYFFISVYLYMCDIYTSACVYICTYLHMYICISVHLYIYTLVYLYLCICTYICISVSWIPQATFKLLISSDPLPPVQSGCCISTKDGCTATTEKYRNTVYTGPEILHLPRNTEIQHRPRNTDASESSCAERE